MVMVDDLM